MPRRRIALLSTLFLLGPLMSAAGAHENDISTAAGHAEEDAVVHTEADETRLQRESATATRGDATVARAQAAGPKREVGEWGPVVDWPVVAMHVALLPNGKVLAYDSVGDRATESYPNQTQTRATVWDPATGVQTKAWEYGFNIFCSGLSHLMDGTVFTAGGNKDTTLNGIRNTYTFDQGTNTWNRGKDMAAERWYPTVTAQPNGEMLIVAGKFGGTPDPKADTAEVRETDGDLRTLGSATLAQPLYPWMDVAPDGRTFNSGPDNALRYLDSSGSGSWSGPVQRDLIDRDYGSRVLYDVGKLLVAGGGVPASKDTRKIDINGSSPVVTAATPMAYGRRQHNLTVLADGSVLATGGLSSSEAQVDLNNSVYPAERWDPATGKWTELAAMARTRQYHSTALLLPDGRVLSGGGGVCGVCDNVKYLERNAEVFSPPYLFAADGSPAPRPAIDAAPAATTYGASLPIATDEAASIRKVALVRLGAVTHSNNMEQRYVPLSFTTTGSTVTAKAPANGKLAPPGVYMLFVVDANGVPSVSRMVNVGLTAPPANTAPTVSLQTNGQSFATGATVSLAATAADPGGAIAKVDFFRDGVKLGQATTAPYTATWAGVPDGTYVLSAVATDADAATTTSAPVTITVRASVPPATTPAQTPPPGSTPTPPGSTPGSPTTPPGSPTPPPGGTPPQGTVKTNPPAVPALLRDLAVVGRTPATRQLRFTLARPATIRLTLTRRSAGRWVRVPGTRSARLTPGRRSISLRTPWAGRRLASGRYRLAVLAGSKVRTVEFTVR